MRIRLYVSPIAVQSAISAFVRSFPEASRDAEPDVIHDARVPNTMVIAVIDGGRA